MHTTLQSLKGINPANPREQLNALAAIAANGGQREFAELLIVCRPMIAALIRKVNFRNPAFDREDLEQIAQIGVHEALETWAPDRASFGTFAGRVVRGRLLNAVRPYRRTRTRRTVDSDLPESGLTDLERLEMRDEANAHLSQMPPRERLIIEGIADGERYADVGSRIGLSPDQLDNIIQRVRRRSRQTRERLTKGSPCPPKM